jgi:hypothetical protein
MQTAKQNLQRERVCRSAVGGRGWGRRGPSAVDPVAMTARRTALFPGVAVTA